MPANSANTGSAGQTSWVQCDIRGTKLEEEIMNAKLIRTMLAAAAIGFGGTAIGGYVLKAHEWPVFAAGSVLFEDRTPDADDTLSDSHWYNSKLDDGVRSSRGLSQFQQPGSSKILAGRFVSPEKSCRIDPQTGCHYGHEETSHPGGCRC